MKNNIFSFRGKTDLLGERRVVFAYGETPETQLSDRKLNNTPDTEYDFDREQTKKSDLDTEYWNSMFDQMAAPHRTPKENKAAMERAVERGDLTTDQLVVGIERGKEKLIEAQNQQEGAKSDDIEMLARLQQEEDISGVPLEERYTNTQELSAKPEADSSLPKEWQVSTDDAPKEGVGTVVEVEEAEREQPAADGVDPSVNAAQASASADINNKPIEEQVAEEIPHTEEFGIEAPTTDAPPIIADASPYTTLSEPNSSPPNTAPSTNEPGPQDNEETFAEKPAPPHADGDIQVTADIIPDPKGAIRTAEGPQKPGESRVASLNNDYPLENQQPPGGAGSGTDRVFEGVDANSDGVLSSIEFGGPKGAFENADTDGSGDLSETEVLQADKDEGFGFSTIVDQAVVREEDENSAIPVVQERVQEKGYDFEDDIRLYANNTDITDQYPTEDEPHNTA
jgi:hypothetical protein